MSRFSSGIRLSGLLAVILLAGVSGCQSGNHYHASSMPNSLRLVLQSNPQEANIGKLASTSRGNDIISPGDVLDVQISASLNKEDQFNVAVRIQNDGSAIVPDIGRIHLGGVAPQAAESLLRAEAVNKGLYRNPTITVSFAHKKVNYVRVLGAVNKPGLKELPPNASDIVSAIAAAEGLADDAGETVEVRNPSHVIPGERRAVAGSGENPYSTVSQRSGGMRAYTVSLTSAAQNVGNQYTIEDGGVVMVQKRDPAPIHVGGLVNNAGEFEVPVGKPLTVLKAIQLAGGPSNQLANKVYVIRPLAQDGKTALIEVSLRKAKRNPREDILLGPGDTVTVEHTPATVLMEAAQLIRFGVSGTTALF